VSCVLANQRRIAIAMDMAPDTHVRGLIEEYLRRKDKPIRPVLVKEAPCKKFHQRGEGGPAQVSRSDDSCGDGGRYLGTGT